MYTKNKTCICFLVDADMVVFISLDSGKGFPFHWATLDRKIKHLIFGKNFFLANDEDGHVQLWKEVIMDGQTSYIPSKEVKAVDSNLEST